LSGVPQVTALYAGLLGLMLLFLSWRVTRLRRDEKIGIGDGGSKELARAIRVQANFVEYVGPAVALMLLLELNGFGARTIHVLGITLVAARVLHAYGLGGSGGYSFGRFWGTLVTWVVLALASLLAIAGFLGFKI
jgi:uncharacterized membrane protein YecN with MAPEG domain